MKNRLTIKKGFTLTELLVVVGILGALSTTVILNYRGYEKKGNLDLQAQEAKTLLTEALDLSLAPTDNTVNGYGVEFDRIQKQIFLFGNKDANNSYGPGIDRLVKKVPIKKGISITEFWEGATLVGDNQVSIMFKLPSSDPDHPYVKETNFHNNSSIQGRIVFYKSATEKKSIVIDTRTNLITVK